jgi:hypothetical protein
LWPRGIHKSKVWISVKRRVTEVEGGRLRVDRAGKRELLALPAGVSVGEGEL